MSTARDDEFPFAFGEGAADQFKERLKELMRAQQEAFEEVQAETPMRSQPTAAAAAGQLPDRYNVVQQAVTLAAAGLDTLGPQESAEEAADAMALLFSRAMTAVQGALRQRKSS